MIKNSLFNLKSSFHSEGIYIFVLTLRKRIDKKAKVNFKIYEVTIWKKAIAIHVVLNISGNETVKWGQIKEYRVFFFKKHARNKAGRLVSDLFLFFRKALNEVKTSDLHLSFNIFLFPST